MDFAAKYADRQLDVRRTTREALLALERKKTRSGSFGMSYEMVRANILHVLGAADCRGNRELAASVVEEHRITTDVDNTAEFLADLARHMRLSDPVGVMDHVREGANFFFAGFHTGPYWSILTCLLQHGRRVVVLLPPALAGQKAEFTKLSETFLGETRFGSQFECLEAADPAFARKAKSAALTGHQIVMYLDGYGTTLAQQPAANDAHVRFLGCELRLKTTVARLARIVNLPIVCFNARRTTGPYRELYIEGEWDLDRSTGNVRADNDAMVNLLFQKLAARVAAEPAQWDGWFSINALFSDAFLQELKSRPESAQPSGWTNAERYFIEDKGANKILVDRFTYAAYRLRDRTLPGATMVN